MTTSGCRNGIRGLAKSAYIGAGPQAPGGRRSSAPPPGTPTQQRPAALSARRLPKATLSGGNADFIQAARRANQTASQSVGHPGIIWVQPGTSFTPTVALSCLREITDTERAIAMNVSLTCKGSDALTPHFRAGRSLDDRGRWVSMRVSPGQTPDDVTRPMPSGTSRRDQDLLRQSSPDLSFHDSLP
jgi:hypothetical protein